jgi:tetratricopeptide (TPR) repeat protein
VAYGDSATPLALAIALLWAVHPLQTESVTYIVQRAESLVALFYLLTLYCVIRSDQSDKAIWWEWGAVLGCLAGMATKEVMVTAPLIVLLYDRTFLTSSFGQALRRRSTVYAALAATWGLLIYLVLRGGRLGNTDGFGAPGVLGAWSYLWSEPAVILHYLRLCFWPSPLCLDYAWPEATKIGQILPGLLVVGLLVAATISGLIGGRRWGFLGAWFLLILAPTSSVLPMGDLAFEHRMYLPLAAVTVAVVLGGYFLFRALLPVSQKTLVPVFRSAWSAVLAGSLVGVVGLGMGGLTFQRNGDYQSELSIWRDTVAKAPWNARAHTNLGACLWETGGTLDEAIAQYRMALEFDPRYALAHHNLGVALYQSGNIDEAQTHYQKALEIDPKYPDAYNSYGFLLENQGNTQQAFAYYRKALELNPYFKEAYTNLGNVLNRQGKCEEAIASYQHALEIDPHCAEAHYDLGIVLNGQGKIAEAMAHYSRAIESRPEFYQAHTGLGDLLFKQGKLPAAMAHFRAALRLRPDDVKTLNLLAWLLATGPKDAIAHGSEAVELAQRAVQLSGGRDAALLDTLAAAYAEARQFPSAVRTGQVALELAVAEGNAVLARAIRNRVDLYRAGSTFHDFRLAIDAGADVLFSP